MEETSKKYTIENLQKEPYRKLQKITKSMQLPSNVKKDLMITLILTNVHGPIEKLDTLIDQVKKERSRQALLRKRRSKQKAENISLSSSSRSPSPTITTTPKRPSPVVVRCNPIRRAIQPSKFMQSITQPLKSSSQSMQSITQPKQSITQPMQSITQPMQSITQPMQSIPQPMRSITEPKLLVQSTHSNSRPIRSLTQPMSSTQSMTSYQPIKPRNELKDTRTYYESRVQKVNIEKRTREKSLPSYKVVKAYSNSRVNHSERVLRNRIEKLTYPNALRGSAVAERSSSYAPIIISKGDDRGMVKNYCSTLQQTSDMKQQSVQTKYTYEYVAGGISIKNKDGVITQVEAYVKRPCSLAVTKDIMIESKRCNKENTRKVFNKKNTNVNQQHQYKNTKQTQSLLSNYSKHTQTNNRRQSNKKVNNRNEILERNEDFIMRSEANNNDYNIQQRLGKDCSIQSGNNYSIQSNNNYSIQSGNNYSIQSGNNYSIQSDYVQRQDRTMQGKGIFDENTSEITSFVQNSPHFDSSMSIENNSGFINDTDTDGYFHKKIRAESVRSRRATLEMQRRSKSVDERRLSSSPVDSDSTANASETDICITSNTLEAPPPPRQQVFKEIAPTSALIQPYYSIQQGYIERLYNIPNQYLNVAPAQRKTTDNTHCVYTSPLYTTCKVHISTPEIYQHDVHMPMQGNTLNVNARNSFGYFPNVAEHGAYTNGYSYGKGTTERVENGEGVLPDMVADALEIISQDGDYMERMGMDVRVQCVVCSWAGPHIILEHHIRKEHSPRIHKITCQEWRINIPLGALCRHRVWVSELLESSECTLYVASAFLSTTGCICASLSSVNAPRDLPPRGSIIIYNKITAQPFIWEGEIPNLPPTLPYENNTHCFVLPISNLDILPDNAIMRLIDLRLSSESPEMFINEMSLDRVEIEMYVKMFTGL